MSIDELRVFLLWSLGLNYALLLFWAGMFLLARDWMYRLHGRWFTLSEETFDAIHYGGMGLYKIGIFLFNLMPLLALCFMAP